VRYGMDQSFALAGNDAEAVVMRHCGMLDVVSAGLTLIRLARTGMLSTSTLSEAPLFRHVLTACLDHYGR
jgi:hypothetical protein